MPDRTWDRIDIGEAALSGQVIAGTIYRWIADKGFGFMRCSEGEAFVHVSAIHCGEAGMLGKRSVAKVVADASLGPVKFRATMVQTDVDYEEELAVRRAAEAAAEAAVVAEEATRRATASRGAVELRPHGLAGRRRAEAGGACAEAGDSRAARCPNRSRRWRAHGIGRESSRSEIGTVHRASILLCSYDCGQQVAWTRPAVGGDSPQRAGGELRGHGRGQVHLRVGKQIQGWLADMNDKLQAL